MHHLSPLEMPRTKWPTPVVTSTHKTFLFYFQMADALLNLLPRQVREQLNAALTLQQLAVSHEEEVDAEELINVDGPTGQESPKVKKTLQKYTADDKERVRDMHFKQNMTPPQIIAATGIPRSNVYAWLSNKHMGKHGNYGLLSDSEELLLVSHICAMAKLGHGLTNHTVRLEVGHLLRKDAERSLRLIDGLPSKLNFISI